MELISGVNQPEIWYEEISAPFTSGNLLEAKQYRCILFVNDGKIQDKDRDALSAEIARGYCSKIFFFGKKIEDWRDSIESACFCPGTEDEPMYIDPSNYDEPQKVISAALSFKDDLYPLEYFLVLFVGKNDALKDIVMKDISIRLDHRRTSSSL